MPVIWLEECFYSINSTVAPFFLAFSQLPISAKFQLARPTTNRLFSANTGTYLT